MGLSEREQQLLDDMERRLYQSEADVMQTPSGVKRSLNRRTLVLGIVLTIVGLGVLIGGVSIQQLWLGLIGFAAMLGGVVLASSKHDAQPVDGSAPAAKQNNEALGDRMRRRWEERMDGER